jgi:hypothetical protein
MNKKIILILKSIIIGVCLSAAIRYGFQSVTFYPILIIVLQIIGIYFGEFRIVKQEETKSIEPSNEIDVTKLTIGQNLVHKDLGTIRIEGIKPHCGDYAIIYKDKLGNHTWVYLKNCKLQ